MSSVLHDTRPLSPKRAATSSESSAKCQSDADHSVQCGIDDEAAHFSTIQSGQG
ncbi:hypothetical protein [Mycobacterium colombiense]|uniref:hypothetical protein n=1 Tax=Mycobacterium colombiense TaxID=339268 RepID=UPI0012DB3C05|nr:hypothetical protein [Mycobacterium colombiense]